MEIRMTKSGIRINDEVRTTNQPAMGAVIRYSGFVILVSAGLTVGCSSNKPPATQPSGVRERQEEALKDPFGYSPEVGRSDISGGDVGHLDKKAMRKDIDHVLNP